MRLDDALALANGGRFAEALHLLETNSFPTAERIDAEVLRAELLEKLGNYPQARSLAERLLRSRSLSPVQQCDCRLVVGRMQLFQGQLEKGLEDCTRALALAREAKDFKRACWIQLWLLVLTCDKASAEAASKWILQSRAETTRAGDPQLSAALHIFVGELAGKHGASKTAQRHTDLGLKLLETSPNVWLQAWGKVTLVALALLQGDFRAGTAHADSALTSAELSGAVTPKIASLGNLGNLAVLDGMWERARHFYAHASEIARFSDEQRRGLLESNARLHLIQDRFDEAHALLDQIDELELKTSATAPYSFRHSQLTRSLVLKAEGDYDRAFAQTLRASELAERAGDIVLRLQCDLAAAEISFLRDDWVAFFARIEQLQPSIQKLPVELRGHYERILGAASAKSDVDASLAHLRRSARVFQALGNTPGAIELTRTIKNAHPGSDIADVQKSIGMSTKSSHVVQDVLTMLLHVGRPELLATDMVEVLASSGCVAHAVATSKDENGREQTLASYDEPPDGIGSARPARTYRVGQLGNCAIQVSCEPLHTVEAVATVNAVASLLEVVKDLDAARAEREERLGLWPIEEFPDDEDGAVISGAMREVMRLARKVAPTSATVLLTGESGTGKEVVARAIHRFATRPGHSFVPFNCHAVPRELLESHLFGYRRGAFTGAERDHPGVIRTAKEGTLFLDEIGELGLESQPKLLRFLESNEIHPLGETEPVKVKTRIVAATNANLEALVNEGKFRADLFYRLRVVPIQIPPLRERRDEIPELALHFVAKAAQEYGKGQITIDDETLELLTLYSWPGNVRQLNNELRRIVALADSDVPLTADMLPPEIRRSHSAHQRDEAEGAIAAEETLAAALGRVEKQMIAAALKTYRGKLDETARALGISRKGLYLKRLRFGL